MEIVNSSYKDKNGFVFLHQKEYYRAVMPSYEEDYNKLMQSGLYDKLIAKKWLIPHKEINNLEISINYFKVLKPLQLPLITYGYEWSFSMLKDAALLTLNITKLAMEHGMILKDANTNNIQFFEGKPIFIDTLSFELYKEKESWVAYKQFCECYIAPLALMKYNDVRTLKFLSAFPNGMPIDLCKKLLPFKAKFNLHIWMHIFLQSKYQYKTNDKKAAPSFSKQKMETLLNGLITCIEGMYLPKQQSVWNSYYEDGVISQEYVTQKANCIKSYFGKIDCNSILDLGANDGYFSLLQANTNKNIISVDFDAYCIENLYNKIKKDKIPNITPLVIDLQNPSAALGWDNTEYSSIKSRMKSNVVMALALVHHLAIANNLPFSKFFQFFNDLGDYLIVEYIGKNDPKVQQLLSSRKDIFNDYNIENFKKEMQHFFDIIDEQKIENTERILFLAKRNS